MWSWRFRNRCEEFLEHALVFLAIRRCASELIFYSLFLSCVYLTF